MAKEIDFRGKREREADLHRAQQEEADYKQMYAQVVADNTALHAKLDQINADRQALETRFAEVLDAFAQHREETQRYLDDLRGINQTIEDMVRTSYQQNQELMERYRADLSQRLERTRDSLADPGDDQ